MSRMTPEEMDGQFKKAVAAVKTLSVSFLQELQTVISDEIEKQKKYAVRDAAAEVNKIAARLGMSPEELVRIAKATKPDQVKQSLPPKYRHPVNAELQWSGMGRKPKWVNEWLEQHGTLSATEITLQ